MKMKNLRVIIIRYDLKKGELALYGLSNYIQKIINPALPVDVMLILRPTKFKERAISL
jgi:hypothetical protein